MQDSEKVNAIIAELKQAIKSMQEDYENIIDSLKETVEWYENEREEKENGY